MAGWMRLRIFTALLAFVLSLPLTAQAETVVLLHGLGRGPGSLAVLEARLRSEGYKVRNIGYASRSGSVAELAEQVLDPVFGAGREVVAGEIVHVVTHSLGGVLLRKYLAVHGRPPALGRVVMLAPPNGGSEIVDALSQWAVYRWLNGPAGTDLGTAPDHAPSSLGPLPEGVEVGVVAGDFSWNPVFSALIPGPDDGKVGVVRTHVAGERDHIVLPYSHTWIMNRAETGRLVTTFLRHGVFGQKRAASEPTDAAEKKDKPSTQ